MSSSDEKTVNAYIASIDEGRREQVMIVLEMVRNSIPRGYEEVMNWGMITWQVPLSVEPDTYNGKPLMFAALASQKRHISLYMMPVYQDPVKLEKLTTGFEDIGKKPNMGKSCIRFTKAENIPLDTLAQLIADSPMKEFIANCKH